MEVPEKPVRGRKPKADAATVSEETLNFGTQMVFAGIATMTGHDFWGKTHEECETFATLAKKTLDRLAKDNPAMYQSVEKHIDPALLLATAAMLVIPSLATELAIRRNPHAYPDVRTPQPGNGGNPDTTPFNGQYPKNDGGKRAGTYGGLNTLN